MWLRRFTERDRARRSETKKKRGKKKIKNNNLKKMVRS
jgi:hypothetical protein